MRGDRDDGAEPGALRPRVEQPDRRLMPRMPRQARVVHAADRRMPGHRGGEQHRGGALAVHPQRQRLQPPAEQERLVGGQRPAGVDAHRADLADQAGRSGHDPAGGVRVAAQVLGGGVQHQVRAVFQRPADHRGRHGGVHHQQRAVGVRDLGQGGQVGHGGGRIGHRLRVHDLSFRPHRRADLIQVGDVHEIGLHPESGRHVAQEAVRAPVDRGRRDHVPARPGKGPEHRADRGHPGGKGLGRGRPIPAGAVQAGAVAVLSRRWPSSAATAMANASAVGLSIRL